jgi:exodeoxyribonuclease V beta subunit
MLVGAASTSARRTFVEHRGAHFREELEERLRLLYVALTRAVHAVHVYWVDRGHGSSQR